PAGEHLLIGSGRDLLHRPPVEGEDEDVARPGSKGMERHLPSVRGEIRAEVVGRASAGELFDLAAGRWHPIELVDPADVRGVQDPAPVTGEAEEVDILLAGRQRPRSG